MTATVPLKPFGDVLVGLDWIELAGADSIRTEVSAIARPVNGKWQYLWKAQNTYFVAVTGKEKGRSKTPVAGGALLKFAIKEQTYLMVLRIDEERFWLFGAVDGVPGKGMDIVGTKKEVLSTILDFFAHAKMPVGQVVVYSDCISDLLVGTVYAGVQAREFSLEVLAHSLSKKQFQKAAFSRHRRRSLVTIIGPVVLVIAAGGWYAYQEHEAAQGRSRAMLQSREEAARRSRETAAQLDKAINERPPLNRSITASLAALDAAPMMLQGWRLMKAECDTSACVITYAAGPFATWRGYEAAKPESWPKPEFGRDIRFVIQPIPVDIPAFERRTVNGLPQRHDLILDLGNLAQTAVQVGVTISLDPNAGPLIVSPAGTKGAPLRIPVRIPFSATGAASFTESFAGRLPASAAFKSLTIEFGEKPSFNIQGEAYANP